MKVPWQKIMPWLSVALLVVSIIVPLGLLGWLVFFTDTFSVQAITVVDARPHLINDIRTLVQQNLNARPQLTHTQTIFAVNTHHLEQVILSTFPSVRDVRVTRELPGTIKVLVQEKRPELLLLTHGTYYFVDDTGSAYEEARLELLPGIVLPTVKNKDASSTVQLGLPVLSPEFVVFVKEMQKKLPETIKDVQVAEIYIPSLAAKEVTFRLTNNWDLRFDSTRAVSGQLTVLNDLLTHTLTEADKKTLQYVDLRIPSRVYYKTATNE